MLGLSKNLDFQRYANMYTVCVFVCLFYGVWVDVQCSFVEIGDHHCVNLLFIKTNNSQREHTITSKDEHHQRHQELAVNSDTSQR